MSVENSKNASLKKHNASLKILILGAGGFVGASLVEKILKERPLWHVYALDPASEKLVHLLDHSQLTYQKGTMQEKKEWILEHIQQADIVIPLAAIADPSVYVTNPLGVFNLDFEQNLDIIRMCVTYKKHLLFPSTSEVYGLCEDEVFNEDTTHFTTGPTHKQRWIYSTSKQLLDRLIFAYGEKEGLSYTIFRPFNWIGPYLDHVDLEKGGKGRVLAKFLGNLLKGEAMVITGNGLQRRSFTDIDDALEALFLMIENKNKSRGCIFNIGNPNNDMSIKTFAETLLTLFRRHELAPLHAQTAHIVYQSEKVLFGSGYQDIQKRIPCVKKALSILGWTPCIPFETTLKKIIDYHLKRLLGTKDLTSTDVSEKKVADL